MIQDLNDLAGDSVFDCDLCIVGSGAAGLALAHELLNAGRRIIMLESGSFAPEPQTQDLYEADVHGHPFFGHMTGRFRIHGGSTTQWGGQALPLSQLDFERRPWVAHSGWPIRLDELIPYYQRASAFLMIDPHNFDSDLFRLLRFDPPQFDRQLIHYHFSKWSRRPNLRETYGTVLRSSAGVTLLLHANLMRITLSGDLSHVSELRVQSLARKTATVRARHTVLCIGGIETARVLLANDHQQPGGIGNTHDLVGRYFQDHPIGVAGIVHSDNSDELQRLFHTFYHRGLKLAPRFSATREAQVRHRILNASAFLTFDTGADSPYAQMKEAVSWILRRGDFSLKRIKPLLRGLRHGRSVARPVYEYLIRHRGYAPDPIIRLMLTLEQEPNPSSRISLSEQRDALGMPRSRICWALTELTLKTASTYAAIVQNEFERLGLGRIELADWLKGSNDWRSALGDQFHHMGTARMGDSPAVGVVDRHCRVHGIDNLWIASSAVFPTSGHSNPTLTLVALTIRLADELRKRLA